MSQDGRLVVFRPVLWRLWRWRIQPIGSYREDEVMGWRWMWGPTTEQMWQRMGELARGVGA